MSTTPRRILVLTWFYDNQPGFEVYRQRLRALASLGEVVLVVRHPRFEEEFRALGIRVEVLRTEDTEVPTLLRYLARCAALGRRGRWDLVVMLGAQTTLARLLLPAGTPSAVYWNEHPSHFFSFGNRNPFKRWTRQALIALAHAAARRATRVMPIGHALEEDLVRHGVAPQRIRVVPMGVNPEFARLAGAARETGAPDLPLRLFYAGTVSVERGRDVMLEGLAAARARGAAATLTLVGLEEARRDEVQRIVGRLGLDGHVTLVGRVPGSAVPRLMREADLGVCLWAPKPWWQFNPPTKLFEYQVAGLPVLASRIRTHTDYIDDGRNGFLFDYSPDGFAEAVCRACALRESLPAIGARSREDGAAHLWPAVEPQFLHVVREAMAQEAVGRPATRVSTPG